MSLKVITLMGTRPEFIKLALVVAELDRYVDHVLVHAGQNFDFELDEGIFRDLGIRKPQHFLEAAADTPARTIAQVIERFDRVLAEEAPDALLLLGDTNSCLGAIAAKRRKIPIFHMEAGNRCFDMRVPEEINRRIVDHVSDINLTYTEHARRYLLAEGLRPDMVIKTGSPMREVLAHYRPAIDTSDVLTRLDLKPREYLVVSAHREENVDDPESLGTFLATLTRMVQTFERPILVSTHPRTRKRLEALGNVKLDDRIRLMKPFGFLDYCQLQMNAACVVSDSGTITEESSILGFPAVTIRNAHERPEGMDEGTLIMAGISPDRVIPAIDVVMKQAAAGFRPRLVADYDADSVSAKVVRIILSYTDYVRSVVWRE